MADSVHTIGAPEIDRRAVMRNAWAAYRRQAGDSEFPFSRKLFAAHLRGAWDAAKYMAFRQRREAEEAAKLASSDPAERRAAEIRCELRSLEMSDFVDWPRHRDLSAQLFRLAAA